MFETVLAANVIWFGLGFHLFGLRSKVDQLIEEDGVTRTNSLGELATSEITLPPKPADSELVSTAGKD